jgi:hypothetical protein
MGVGFLKTMNMKMTASWDLIRCSLIDTDGRFIGDYCLHNWVNIMIVITTDFVLRKETF